MIRKFILAIYVSCFAAPSVLVAEDWRVWRGPTLDNHTPASAASAVPVKWSESQNVKWKSPIPGKGHASPIVVNDTVYILTHRPMAQTIELIWYHLADGKELGKTVLFENVVPPNYLHKKNTCASSTPSSDGKSIFISAQVGSSIQAVAVSLDGKVIWEQKVAPYRAGRGWFGYGASLLLLDNAVIVPVDTDNGDRGLYALDKNTGHHLWKAARPQTTSYSSPVLANIDGQAQVLISGGYQVNSYDPKSGDSIWSVKATSRTTCASMVWTDDMAFASGSYPDPGTYGIKVAGGKATVAWENRVKCYEQSMLIVGEYLYGIADSGVAYCWRCDDGKEMWKQRLQGPFSASPLLVGDRIYASNERGKTFVFKANPQRFERLSENVFGDSSFASPVYSDGKLLIRHAKTQAGRRQEYLVAISN